MPLSEHVYCVAVAFKVTEWVEPRICIKFCVKLEHSSVETIQMIHKAAAMGIWWLTASSQQCACSSSRLVQRRFGQTSNHPSDSAPLQPVLVPYNFRVLPKLKSSLEGKRFSTIDEIQENMTEQLMANGRTVWGPKVPTLEGTKASLS